MDYFEKWLQRIGKIIQGAKAQLAIFITGNKDYQEEIKLCEQVGIKADVYYFPKDISEDDFAFEVAITQDHYTSVLIDSNYDLTDILDNAKDVGGMKYLSLFDTLDTAAIMKYLNHIKFNVKQKHILILGQCNKFGVPLARTFIDRGGSVAICPTGEDFEKYLNVVDIIINCAPGVTVDCAQTAARVINIRGNIVNAQEGKDINDLSIYRKYMLVEHVKRSVLFQDKEIKHRYFEEYYDEDKFENYYVRPEHYDGLPGVIRDEILARRERKKEESKHGSSISSSEIEK